MPPSFHRTPFPALIEPAADDGADRELPRAVIDEPPPWPWRVAVPLIAGLSLALWVGLARVVRVIGAG